MSVWTTVCDELGMHMTKFRGAGLGVASRAVGSGVYTPNQTSDITKSTIISPKIIPVLRATLWFSCIVWHVNSN